jgi:hypothetical protein
MCPVSGGRSTTNESIIFTTCVLLCAIVATTIGCGDKSEKTAAAKAAANADADASSRAVSSKDVVTSTKPSANSKSLAEQPTSGAEKPKKSPPAETDNTPRKPATAEEAQRVLDLTKFPLPEGAQVEGQSSIALLRYGVPSDDVKSAFDFVRQQFTKRGWKETGETNISAQYAMGTFAGQGFYADVRAYPDSSKPDSKLVKVSIANQGNLNLATLPVPPGAKQHYSTPPNVGYLTEMPIEEVVAAVDKLLTEQGWTPYGDNIGTKVYKQNAIELKASISAMPDLPDKPELKGKNMISFFSGLMSADLPAPPQPLDVTYTDYMSPPKQLLFESAAAREEIYQFYRDTLAKDGWEPTTEKPITDKYKAFMIFRNKAKDLLELETENPQQGKIRGKLRHQSAAELAEIERQIELDRPRREAELKRKSKEEADRKAQIEQEKRDEEAAEKLRRRVVVSLPADAKQVTFEAEEIEFTLARGKAKGAADNLGKQFRDSGWKERSRGTEAITGTHLYAKDGQSITITYIDSPILGTEVRVSGFRVDFEKAAAGKK